MKDRSSGYQLPIAVPGEEMFMAAGETKLPLKIAADEALANCKEVRLEHWIFPSQTLVKRPPRKELNISRLTESFVLEPHQDAEREFASEHAHHSAKCRPTPVVPATPAPAPATPSPVAAEVVEDEVDAASFSAGVVPGEEWREALVGKINHKIDNEFVHAEKERNKQR